MKKYALFLLFLVFTNLFYAQSFQKAYDDMLALEPNGYSTGTPNAANYGWATSYVMRSYIKMYKGTNNVNYLNNLIISSKRVQDGRGYHNGACGLNYNTWSYTSNSASYPVGYPCWNQAVENFLIMQPMAEFIYLVRIENPSLASHILPSDPVLTNLSLTTYGQYADWLETRIVETISEFNSNNNVLIDKWKSFLATQLSGYYKATQYGGGKAAINKQSACATTLLLMSQVVSSPSLQADYLQKASILAWQFKLALGTPVGDHYEWCHTQNCSSDKEDLSHGALEIELASLCYKFQVQYNNTLLFGNTEMDRLSRTITESAYIQPLQMWFTVFGDNDWYDSPSAPPADAVECVGRWLALSEYYTGANADRVGRDIYHIASNIFVDMINDNWGLSATRLLSLSYLTQYQDLFSYVAYEKSPGPDSQWAGVEGGDFDGDGVDEFITVRNFDGAFLMFELQNGDVVQIASNNNSGSASQWADVAAGDFDGDGIDEFVAVRNFDGDFYMYELQGSTIVPVAQNHLPGSNSQWAGIAAGDFDNDGIDEFVAVSNYNGAFYMYELQGGNIVPVAQDYTAGSASQWAGVTAGDFDNDGIDEYAAVRNFDGDIFIYELQGTSIVSIARDYSPGSESLWTDITAGDFDGDGIDEIIAHRNSDGDMYMYQLLNGSIVSEGHEYFTAGQLIDILGAGNVNHNLCDDLICLRNIDGDILIFSIKGRCNKVVIRPKLKTMEINDITRIQNDEIRIYPNPNTGVFTIEIEEDLTDNISVEIYSMQGTLMYSESFSENSSKTVDLGAISEGLYLVRVNASGKEYTRKLRISPR